MKEKRKTSLEPTNTAILKMDLFNCSSRTALSLAKGSSTTERNQENQLPNEYQFRLPSETEWEYAFRAGTKTPFSYGDYL